MTATSIDSAVPAVAAAGPRRPGWRQRFLRGPAEDPRWARPALLGLLVATAALYLWDLSASGWANSFYSAAVEAGSKSWKAMFFGSFDSSSFITVDKPPASLWVMELSARVFGVSSWSILVPQALAGVGAVALLYATVRRRFGAAAGLVAGAVLATTPVATLMFRYNNPDALLVLLLVGAAYALTRALESASGRWLMLAGALIGFGFITKMLQAFLVLPGFALVYLCYAPTTMWRRVRQLLVGGLAIVVTAGWWVAAVSLTPAADRPYIGGSTDNSILSLAFGYNGLGRLTGNETGSVGGGGGAGGMWGATGITRLFGTDMGTQISWLIPAALICGAAAWYGLRRQPDAAGRQAQLVLWGSWLAVTGLVFSFSRGIIHPYYTVALAPAIGALLGIGAVTLWRLRDEAWARVVSALALIVTALWAVDLLRRTPSWHPWLQVVVLVVGVLTAAAVLLRPSDLRGRLPRAGVVIVIGAVVTALAAPAAYSLDTATTAHLGAIPSAGPAATAGGPGGAGPGGFGRAGGLPRGARAGGPGIGGGQGGFGIGPGAGPGRRPGALGSGGFRGTAGGGRQQTGGGLLNAGTVSAGLASALQADARSYRWVAAAIGAENASGFQLASSEPIMAIGGFNGTDPAPTLAEFESYVARGDIHYFIAGGAAGPGGGGAGQSSSSDATQITQWVESHFTARTIGGTTVYDLTSPNSSASISAAGGSVTT
jgi:4-amino-4-deoxy-L-arabinose transferase-like glycosyltransferase